MIICTKCQRTYNPLAFFGPYRNQVPIFSGSLLRNSTISHSAGMLKPYNRSGPWAIKFQPIPGETTISIHQIESSEGIIFSDGRRTAGRKYWTDEVQAWLTHCEQRRRVPQFNFASGEKPLTRKLWARLGVSLRITAEEEAVIFGADETLSEETLRKIILDGRFTPDGDSYVPEPAAKQFNEDYGTNHPVRDIGFEM